MVVAAPKGPSREELEYRRKQAAQEEERRKLDRFRDFFNIRPPEPPVEAIPTPVSAAPDSLEDFVEQVDNAQMSQPEDIATCGCESGQAEPPAAQKREVFAPGKGLARRMIDISDLY